VISVSTLLCESGAAGDGLRYDAADSTDVAQIRQRKQQHPVVVWNTTTGCNLDCRHCYAGARGTPEAGEFDTAEARGLIDELAAYDVPVLLFSGGEPLLRDDLVELVEYASDRGLRPVLSSNGTLLTEARARELAAAGIAYAGISIDGLPDRHDTFRGCDGAFAAASAGIAAAQAAGIKTGVRFTVTEQTLPDLPAVLERFCDRGVDRFCFYHLAYGGRGRDARTTDIDPQTRRAAVREICDLTRQYHARDEPIETLLVGNYADAGYLVEYARLAIGADRARRIESYLRTNGGDPAGERVADIDAHGNVHPTQFWRSYSMGNVRDRPFAAIWEDDTNPVLDHLRQRPESLGAVCADCRYSDCCRGGSRLRALAVHSDRAAPDPQCYLTPTERGSRSSVSSD